MWAIYVFSQTKTSSTCVRSMERSKGKCSSPITDCTSRALTRWEAVCIFSFTTQSLVLLKDSLQHTLLLEQLSDRPAFLFEVNVLSGDISDSVSQVSSLHLTPPLQQCNIQQLPILLMTCQLALKDFSLLSLFFIPFFVSFYMSLYQPWDVFCLPPFSYCCLLAMQHIMFVLVQEWSAKKNQEIGMKKKREGCTNIIWGSLSSVCWHALWLAQARRHLQSCCKFQVLPRSVGDKENKRMERQMRWIF